MNAFGHAATPVVPVPVPVFVASASVGQLSIGRTCCNPDSVLPAVAAATAAAALLQCCCGALVAVVVVSAFNMPLLLVLLLLLMVALLATECAVDTIAVAVATVAGIVAVAATVVTDAAAATVAPVATEILVLLPDCCTLQRVYMRYGVFVVSFCCNDLVLLVAPQPLALICSGVLPSNQSLQCCCNCSLT